MNEDEMSVSTEHTWNAIDAYKKQRHRLMESVYVEQRMENKTNREAIEWRKNGMLQLQRDLALRIITLKSFG